MKYAKLIIFPMLWLLAIGSPNAVAEMLTEEKDFPAYEWIDKVPRKYKDCSSGYCIKLKLNKKKNKDITRLLNYGVKSSHISSILGVSHTTINKVKLTLNVK